MANVACGSRVWTDPGVSTAVPGTVTVARPSAGVLYVRVLRGGVPVSEAKTSSTGATTVSRDYEANDAVRIWIGASTSKTVAVTTVNR